MGIIDEEYFYKAKTVLPESEQKTADNQSTMLRKSFITNWVVNSNLDLYRTDTEKDWAYIVRREYRALGYSAFFKSIAFCSALQVANALFTKKIRFYYYAFLPVFYFPFKSDLFERDHKRLFDMLNIGTEYDLGAERNRVLEEANRISKRADF